MTNKITITWDDNSSHSHILKQLISALAKHKFAPRAEMESEFAALLATKTYRTSIG